MPDLSGKTIVITGATSGIGQVAAERLAEMGARIVQIARDKSRAEAALARLRPGAKHAVHFADLSSTADMKRVAAEVSAAEPRIDILVNNAGAMFNSRGVTIDNLERTFATNHVAYYVLTLGLLGRLSPTARIVNTASDAHRGARLDFNDLQSEKKYGAFPVYKKSKLANILFTRELARRLEGSKITANSLHPGFVSTRFGQGGGGWMPLIVKIGMSFAAISPEEGAKTIVYLASSDEVEGRTGGYYYKCRPSTPTTEAQDDSSARRLWDVTEALTGVTLVK
jgi:NAD(P)-dependent dehydrogenase (short-subunit alcohol dehydrogenase family)